LQRLLPKELLIALFLLLLAGGLQAGNPKFSQFTADDGLASSMTYGIFEDRDGFVWIATEHGVSRYNGYTFTNFTTDDGLSDNVIFDFFEDSLGRIWFYTFNGIPCFYQDGKITNLASKMPQTSKASRGRICSIFEGPDKTVWISRTVPFTFALRETDSLEVLPLNLPDKSVKVVSSLNQFWSEDSICYLHSGGFLIQYHPESDSWHSNDALKLGDLDLSAPAFSDQWNHGLVIGKGPDLYFLKVVNEQVELVKLGTTPNGKEITTVVVNDKDQFYIGTYAGAYSFQNGQWGNCLLPDYGISCSLIDREGNVWFSTLNNGIFYTSGIDILKWQVSPENKSNNITKIFPDPTDNSLYLGLLDNSIAKFKDRHLTSIPIQLVDTLRNLGPVDIARCNDTLVIAFARGITYYHPASGYQEHLMLPGSIKSLYVSPKGTLYCCTSIGVIRIDSENLRKLRSVRKNNLLVGDLCTDPSYFHQFPSQHRIHTMIQVNDQELLLGGVNGCYKITPSDTILLFADQPELQFTPHSMVQASNGDIWAATHGGGVIRLGKEPILQLTTKDGLITNLCKSIEIGAEGEIWVGSNEGVIRITPPIPGHSKYQIRNFTTQDGLPSNEINDLHIQEDTLWLASPEGLAHVPLSFLTRSTPPPLIYLDSLVINRHRIDSIPASLVLNHRENNINIHFVGLSFQSRGDLTYHYRLLGSSEEWNTTAYTDVEFLSLSPGIYTFEVYATNFKGNRSKETLQINFTIKSPWWEQWWAIAIGFTLLVLIISLFFNRRLQILRVRNKLEMDAARSEQKALRARIAPHFVYNALNSLQSLISDNRRLEALNYTSRFSRLMRKVFEHSVENFIPLEEEIEALEMYLQLEQLRFKDKFTYLIDLEKQLDSSDASIPSMILQPLLENSIWHGLLHQSKPGIIHLKIREQNDLLYCLVEDNGVGREAAKLHRSKYATHKKDSGLEVTRERLMMLARLEQLPNKIKLIHTDLYDKQGVATGTRVEVWLPLKSIVSK